MAKYCSFLFVLFSWPILAAGLEEATGKGTFELQWEPRSCITTPCPQFVVLRYGKTKIEGVGADLDRQDFQKSAMKNFRTFFVKGSYVKDPEHSDYIRIQVSNWYGIVKEDFSSSPSKR